MTHMFFNSLISLVTWRSRSLIVLFSSDYELFSYSRNSNSIEKFQIKYQMEHCRAQETSRDAYDIHI